MTSRHYWPAPLPLGADLLAVVCAACHRPLVPMPSPDDWPRRITEFANRQDCPGNGLDHMEGQNQGEDQARDPGDTMPAQGWLDITGLFTPRPGTRSDYALWPPTTDAGRLPAPRKDSTMAPVEIGRAEIREDFDHAAQRASTIAQFATMHPEQRQEELEARPIRELRELHHQAAGTEAWHQQGMNDARDLSRIIGQALRAAGDEIDPQAKTEAQSTGTLR